MMVFHFQKLAMVFAKKNHMFWYRFLEKWQFLSVGAVLLRYQ